jgi:N-acetylglucosamine-6-phosphate deacetylase
MTGIETPVAGPEAVLAARIAVDGAVLVGMAVLVREGRIEAVVPRGEVPESTPVRDIGDGLLAAGLVDIHAHGAAGRAFNDGDPEGNREALDALLAAGVTTVLPTLSAAPLEQLERALEALAAPAAAGLRPRAPGAHLEGPFFSDAQRGAQDPAALRDPRSRESDRLLEQAAGIRMMSLAPELPGAVRLTERLVAAGIVAAAGHSDGRDEDLFACQRAGLTHVIHVFSGQSSTIRRGPWRHAGILEATLASDGLTVEMIGDGKHLPATLMRLAYRCLRGRLCLVSDSTPGAGMADGATYRMGDMEYIVEDGVGMTLDRTSFGGSTTLISAMIPITMRALGIDVAEAIELATAVPAFAARLDGVGRIAPGYHADFVHFDDGLRPQAVAVGGRWRAQAGRGSL